MTRKPWLRRGGYTIAALWIFGGAFLFYTRFTILFYMEHQAAIDSAVAEFGAWIRSLF